MVTTLDGNVSTCRCKYQHSTGQSRTTVNGKQEKNSWRSLNSMLPPVLYAHQRTRLPLPTDEPTLKSPGEKDWVRPTLEKKAIIIIQWYPEGEWWRVMMRSSTSPSKAPGEQHCPACKIPLKCNTTTLGWCSHWSQKEGKKKRKKRAWRKDFLITRLTLNRNLGLSSQLYNFKTVQLQQLELCFNGKWLVWKLIGSLPWNNPQHFAVRWQGQVL